MASGYAFAALEPSLDDIIVDDGPGGGGQYIDDEREQREHDEDNATYDISCGTIIPYVPFNVTVTASDGNGGGGSLIMSFSDGSEVGRTILSQGKWSDKTLVQRMVVTTCDSTKSAVKLTYRGVRNPKEATASYNAGHMKPSLPSTIVRGESASWSIVFSSTSGGSALSACAATSLSQMGASYHWEAWDGTKWTKVTPTAVMEGSFRNGSVSGTVKFDSYAYSKLRLCVDYAKRQTAYATATLSVADVTIEFGESTLHTWGGGVSLAISSDALAALTAGFYSGDSAYSGIVDANGDPIAFSFSGTSWSGTVYAARNAQPGSVTLKVMSGSTVVESATVLVADAVSGFLTVSKEKVIVNGTFDVSASIMWAGGDLDRVPAGGFKVVIKQGDTVVSETGNSAGNAELEITDVTLSTSGEYKVQLVDARDGSVLDEETVTVMTYKAALAEAINERLTARGHSSAGSYDEDSTASQLHDGARTAVNGFIVDLDPTDGSYTTTYSSSNDGIQTAVDDDEWYQETYEIVCSAMSRRVSSSSNEKKYRYKTSGNITGNSSSTLEEVKQQAISAYNAASWTTSSSSFSTPEAIFASGAYDGRNEGYSISAGIWARLVAYTYTYNLPFSATIDFYMLRNSLGEGYYVDDSWGHHVPNVGIQGKVYSIHVSANVSTTTELLCGDIPSLWESPSAGDIPETEHAAMGSYSATMSQRGYASGKYTAEGTTNNFGMIATYDFTHK